MNELGGIYQQRSAAFEKTALQLQRRYNQLSVVRLLIFIVSVGVAIYCFSLHWGVGVGFVAMFLAAFYRFVVWHSGILEAARFNERQGRINTWENAVLDGDYAVFYPGKEWMGPSHPYLFDLDIFGEYSLYQYLNRATTSVGRKKLAEWLATPTNETEIAARQAALPELRDALDWRQAFQDIPEEAAWLRPGVEQAPLVLDRLDLRALEEIRGAAGWTAPPGAA